MSYDLTPADLLARFRSEVDDLPYASNNDEGCLWSDADIYYYMDRAQQELAKHVDNIRDEIRLKVVADRATLSLPANVIDVHSVYSENANRDLRIDSRVNLGTRVADDYGLHVQTKWRDSTGQPDTVFLDMEQGKLYLVPKPVEDDFLLLLVTKLPDRIDGEACPFAFRRPDHIWALLPYMKYLAYSKHDADAYDPNLSEKYKAIAEETFDRVYHEVQRLRSSNSPGRVTTGYGGIKF